MVTIVELWLPILLSAVFVFVASSVIHMCIPIHKGDYSKLPGEDKIMDSMRGEGLQPGGYMFPCADSMKEMASPEMIEKLNKGPVGFLVVLPNGPMNMGKSLGQWFVFCVAVAAVTGFVASLGISTGASFGEVFKMTVAVAFLGFALSSVTDSIWKGISWVVTAKFIFDGTVYALVTAATFGWLWPALA
jgi:hypothetical protein